MLFEFIIWLLLYIIGVFLGFLFIFWFCIKRITTVGEIDIDERKSICNVKLSGYELQDPRVKYVKLKVNHNSIIRVKNEGYNE